MRAALACLPVTTNDPDANVRRLVEVVRDHVDFNVDVVIAAESYIQGFMSATFDPEEDANRAWTRDDARWEPLRRVARQTSTAICTGYFERNRAVFHSSAMIIGKDGTELSHYRRISVGWREKNVDACYQEGDHVPIFTIADKRCTVALCGDLWDIPERFAHVEPQVVLWPLYVGFDNPDGSMRLWTDAERQDYATQANKVYAHALMVNSVDDHSAGGALWFRNGKIKAEHPMNNTPGVIVVDIR